MATFESGHFMTEYIDWKYNDTSSLKHLKGVNSHIKRVKDICLTETFLNCKIEARSSNQVAAQ